MTDRPYIWIIDSRRAPLAGAMDAFSAWADTLYISPDEEPPDWEGERPNAVFFSAEMPGGPDGDWFAGLRDAAGATPLLAVTALRSLAQAVAFFRAGTSDYLSLPLEENDARERFAAALERMERMTLTAVAVELETLDEEDAGEVEFSISRNLVEARGDEDILADLPPAVMESYVPGVAAEADSGGPEETPDPAGEAEEPVAVDGLPIPNLWEELPCGLMVFDSGGNLVFGNAAGMELLGYDNLAQIQDALENPSIFKAHGANHKPLADNQWPHKLAHKTKTARSAVISVETATRRRAWLRLDCLPHLSEGKVTRLSMTLVNVTGELAPLVVEPRVQTAQPKKEKGKRRGKKRLEC